MLSLTFSLALAASAAAPSAAGADTLSASHAYTLRAPMMLAQTSPPPASSPPAGYAPPPSGYTPPAATATASLGAAPEHRGLSLWLAAPYNYGGFGLGIGARWALPLAIPSLIRHARIHDSWALEFGADFFRYDYYSYYHVNRLVPVCGFMWIVWLNEKFAVYPKAEAGYAIGWVSSDNSTATNAGFSSIWASGAAGLIYKVGESIALRAEVGSYGIKGGVGFVF